MPKGQSKAATYHVILAKRKPNQQGLLLTFPEPSVVKPLPLAAVQPAAAAAAAVALRQKCFAEPASV